MRSLFVSLTIVAALVALAFGEDWLQWGQMPSIPAEPWCLARIPRAFWLT
jgi:hypothetical protein